MTSSALLFNVDPQGIATLSLNRPEVGNAFNGALIEQLIATFKKIDASSEIRVVILQSEGKHFSSGADLNWMKSMANYDFDHNKADSLKLSELMDRLYRLNKPTIAVVQGAAFGGAIGLLACCDIVLASPKAKFCLSEVKLGLSPAVISPYVIQAVGVRQARRYFLTAEVFDAEKALDLQLVHEIVAPENLQSQSQEMANNILKNGPVALAASKTLIQEVNNHFPNEDLKKYTAELIANLRVSEEGQEGISAFFEKRPAKWSIKSHV